jgi:hypothetical protein
MLPRCYHAAPYRHRARRAILDLSERRDLNLGPVAPMSRRLLGTLRNEPALTHKRCRLSCRLLKADHRLACWLRGEMTVDR